VRRPLGPGEVATVVRPYARARHVGPGSWKLRLRHRAADANRRASKAARVALACRRRHDMRAPHVVHETGAVLWVFARRSGTRATAAQLCTIRMHRRAGRKTRGCSARCRTPRGTVLDASAPGNTSSCTPAHDVSSIAMSQRRMDTRQTVRVARFSDGSGAGAPLAPAPRVVSSAASSRPCHGPYEAPTRPAMSRAKRFHCRYSPVTTPLRAGSAPTDVLLSNVPPVIWDTGPSAATPDLPPRWTRDA